MKRIIFIFVAVLAFSFSCSGVGEEEDIQILLEKNAALSRQFSNNLFFSVQELKQKIGDDTGRVEDIFGAIPEGYLNGLIHVLNQSSNIARVFEEIDIPKIVALASRTGHEGLGLGYYLMRIADGFMESIGLRHLISKYFDDLYPQMEMADQLLVSIEDKTEKKTGGLLWGERHDIEFVLPKREIEGWVKWFGKKKSLIGTAGSLALHLPDVPTLRREVQFNIQEKKKDLKFYLINYGLFVLIIGMAAYLIFLFLIYIFQDIHIKELFSKENTKKYAIVILMFCTQNFIFFLNPSQFFYFINFFNMPHRRKYIFENMMYTKHLFNDLILSTEIMVLLTYFFVFAIIIISLILILKKKLIIQEKFGFYFLANVFLGIYSIQHYLFLLLLSFVLLLFIPFYEKDINEFEWIKRNKFFVAGVLSITLLLNRDISMLILRNFAIISLLIIMMICLILLYINY